jgi:hypothetical protein
MISAAASDARVILSGLTLRKDIELAKARIIELECRLEEQDIAEEWELVKRELGISA